MKRRDFLRRSLAGTAFTAAGVSLPNDCFAASDHQKILTGRGLEPASPSHFTRMFPQLAENQSAPELGPEEGLIKLGENMKDDPDSRPDPKKPPPMAGYTYLGQFINHDLTLDLTPLDQAQPDVARMSNLRTPFLDLDHVYGGGPNVSPFLYDRQSKHGEERFLIGETAPSSVGGRNFPSTQGDLPRNSQGIALIGDPRQDENLIIAQLHVAFLKLHNRVLDGLKRGEIKNASGTLFEQARRIVTWHYQWVVRHDFLREILDPRVFEQTFTDERYARKDEGDFQIPVEYSLAAGRFGHSMVRDEYFINETHMEASLRDDVSRLTGLRGGACPRLPAEWVISWERFFFVGSGSGLVRHSRAIDTRLAQGLHEPDQPNSPPLPVKTLLRGKRVGLPSGQDVAHAYGLDPLNPEQIAQGPDKEILLNFGYDTKTPLWYYILKEAELTTRGAHLGVLGSKLVADVIMAAIVRDPDSYHSIDRSWIPTLHGPENPELFGMANLLRFANAI
jgi:hypothetical protein